MGGIAEDVIEQPARTESPSARGVVGNVRFHESGGEVHFHDDVNKLKVAIPMASWWRTWQDLSSGSTKKARLVDPARKTEVVLKVSNKQGVCDVSVKINTVALSTSFEKLQKFSTR